MYTPYECLQYILKGGILFTDELDNKRRKSINSFNSEEDEYSIVDEVYLYANNLIKQFVLMNESLSFNPFQIALACVAITRKMFNFKPKWTMILEQVYDYDYNFYDLCVQSIIKSLRLKNNEERLRGDLKKKDRLRCKSYTSKELIEIKKERTLKITNKEVHRTLKKLKIIKDDSIQTNERTLPRVSSTLIKVDVIVNDNNDIISQTDSSSKSSITKQAKTFANSSDHVLVNKKKDTIFA